jgi:hypothetical protein
MEVEDLGLAGEVFREISLKQRELSQPKPKTAIGKAIAPTYIPLCRRPARLGPT